MGLMIRGRIEIAFQIFLSQGLHHTVLGTIFRLYWRKDGLDFSARQKALALWGGRNILQK